MTKDIEILQFLHYNPDSSRSEIANGITKPPSNATLKRLISSEVKKGNIEVLGKRPSTSYRLSPQANLTMDLNLDTYFDKDIDERKIQETFNFNLINDILPQVELYTKEELELLL